MGIVRTLGAAGTLLLAGATGAQTPSVSGASEVCTGEYVVAIGGCNDCHTDGWNRAPGQIPSPSV
jgi:hypothetical protein